MFNINSSRSEAAIAIGATYLVILLSNWLFIEFSLLALTLVISFGIGECLLLSYSTVLFFLTKSL